MTNNFNNKVIEVLDREHGQKVKKYFNSLGVDTGRYAFSATLEKDFKDRYYGVVNGYFSNFTLRHLQAHRGVEIMTLPEEISYPKVMLVSNNKEFTNSCKRVVIAYKCSKYITWHKAETLEDAEYFVDTDSWNYAKDIEPESNLPKYKVLADVQLYNISKGTEIYLAGLQLSTMTKNSPFVWNNEIIRIPNELVELVSGVR